MREVRRAAETCRKVGKCPRRTAYEMVKKIKDGVNGGQKGRRWHCLRYATDARAAHIARGRGLAHHQTRSGWPPPPERAFVGC